MQRLAARAMGKLRKRVIKTSKKVQSNGEALDNAAAYLRPEEQEINKWFSWGLYYNQRKKLIGSLQVEPCPS